MKAWQLITHESSSPTYRRLKTGVPEAKKDRYGSFRPSEEVFAAWEVTDMIAHALRARMILFQSPASFIPSPEHERNLRRFFSRIDRKGYTLCWEPRGDWQEKVVRRICGDLDLVHCVDPFKGASAYGRVRYFRLHGMPGYDLRYRYRDEDLQELLGKLDRPRAYVLFNNLTMLGDAKRFRRFVERS